MFDEQVVRRDPQVADLMDQFVCPPRPANAMDLSLFQFDYDLTFAVFFLNADKTVYGRFSSRSDRKDATRNHPGRFPQALAAAWTCTKVIQPTRLLWPASNRCPAL